MVKKQISLGLVIYVSFSREIHFFAGEEVQFSSRLGDHVFKQRSANRDLSLKKRAIWFLPSLHSSAEQHWDLGAPDPLLCCAGEIDSLSLTSARLLLLLPLTGCLLAPQPASHPLFGSFQPQPPFSFPQLLGRSEIGAAGLHVWNCFALLDLYLAPHISFRVFWVPSLLHI